MAWTSFCLFALQLAATVARQTASLEHGFYIRSLAPRKELLQLHIALQQHDGGAGIEQHLLRASDPRGPAFRQHLTAAQAHHLSRPASDSERTVRSWLELHALSEQVSLVGNILQVDATVEQAENLLNTTYFVFSDDYRDLIRVKSYHLPDHVQRHVDFVTPTTVLPRPVERPLPKPDGLANIAAQQNSILERGSCGSADYSTPNCIRQLYNITYVPEPNRTTFAVYATECASFDPSDLQLYLETYNKPAASAHATYEVVGAGNADQGSVASKFETALDTQVLMGLAWPAHGVLFNLGGVFGPNVGRSYDPFVKFLLGLAYNQTVPSVVSISESMPEDRINPDYARRLCNMMALVGARGVTLLFSSGNNGPNGDSPDGEHRTIFEPEFPASCPWVTGVGGTTNLADEQGATQRNIPLLSSLGYTSSGGGFSNVFDAPTWQSRVVEDYIKNHVPDSYKDTAKGFPATVGRGIPDVSAISTQWPTVVAGVTVPIGGTSSATPTWAAIITLLNDYQASKGRPSLGFINPWLYSLASGLKDIKRGGNSVGKCNLLTGCTLTPLSLLGYDVTDGWDPVTGLGSPNLGLLIEDLDARGR